MAIQQDTYSPHGFRLGISKQATWGTAITDQAAFLELWLTNRPEQASTPLMDETKRADGSSVHSILDRYISEVGGEHTIAVEGVLTLAQAAHLIFGSVQYITSEGADPFAKVFTLGAAVTPPSTVACILTVLIADPTGNNVMFKDCVFKTMTFSQAPGSAGGRVAFSGTLYTGCVVDTTSVTATPASWIAPGTAYYGLSNLDIPTINVSGGGALDVVVFGWSLTIDNGAKVYPAFDSSGHALGMAIGAGTAGIAITGELSVKYDTNTKSAYGDFLAGSMMVISLPFYATTSTDLSFVINARHKAQPTKDFGSDSGVQITYNFEAINNPTGPVSALVVTVEDGTDRSWA